MRTNETTNKARARLLALIPEGKSNARSMAELAAWSGMEERQLRRMIERLRLEGAIVCSGSGGYYTPADAGELREFYKMYRRRAMTNLASLKAARQLLKALEAEGARHETDLLR